MSFSYRACFVLPTPTDMALLQQFFVSQRMRFGGSDSFLVLRGDKLVGEPGPVCDARAFAENAVSSAPSVYGRFSGEDEEGDEFYFELGFSIIAGTRIAWLEMTERNLDRLGFELSLERKSDLTTIFL